MQTAQPARMEKQNRNYGGDFSRGGRWSEVPPAAFIL
jgi:hypothetical protein